MNHVYVYALAGAPFDACRVGGRRLRTIDVEGVHVVVGHARPDQDLSESGLRRQHAIVEAIASRCDAVLPVRFGALLREADLRRIVAARREAVLEGLELVRDREQMTLRFAAGTSRGPGDADAALAGRRDMPAATGTAYLEQRRRATSFPAAADLQRIQVAVCDLVHAERVHPGRDPFPPAVCHLITRGRSGEYRQRAEVAAADTEIHVSGPWPAFAFGPELFG
jgi:hypothetical protein